MSSVTPKAEAKSVVSVTGRERIYTNEVKNGAHPLFSPPPLLGYLYLLNEPAQFSSQNFIKFSIQRVKVSLNTLIMPL